MRTGLAVILTFTLISTLDAQVLAPHSTVFGKTIAEWTVDHWKWTWGRSTNQHPGLDPDGRWATNGQSGPIFFVAGFGGERITRAYVVPESKFLLFPVLIADAENIDVFPPLTGEQLRDLVASFFTPPPTLRFSINGVPVPDMLDHRETAPLFGFEFTDPDNLRSSVYPHPIVGLVDPIAHDGYWLMLEPLQSGTYIFNFAGCYNLPGGFCYERTDTITVVAVPLTDWVADFTNVIENASVSEEERDSLLRELERAHNSFANGKLHPGINHVRGFQRKVLKQSGLDAILASDFMRHAERIIERARREFAEK